MIINYMFVDNFIYIAYFNTNVKNSFRINNNSLSEIANIQTACTLCSQFDRKIEFFEPFFKGIDYFHAVSFPTTSARRIRRPLISTNENVFIVDQRIANKVRIYELRMRKI